MAPLGFDWREIARREQEKEHNASMEIMDANSSIGYPEVSPQVPTPATPSYSGPSIGQASGFSKEYIPSEDDQAASLREDYAGQTNVLDQFTGGFLRPFEKAIAGSKEPSATGAYQIPSEALTTPQTVARGAGNLAGYVTEYLPFSKLLSGVGAKVLGGSAEKLMRTQGSKIIAREFAGKELTKQVKKQALREAEKSVARRVALQHGVNDALAGGAIAGLESRGDPIETGLGALLSFLPAPITNEVRPFAKAGFNQAVTLGRKGISKGSQLIDDLAETDVGRMLASESGSIRMGGGGKGNGWNAEKDSLTDFVLKHGGVRQEKSGGMTGELKRIGTVKEGGYNLLRKDGVELDRMRGMANDVGYGPFETVDDMVQALDQDIGAKKGASGGRVWSTLKQNFDDEIDDHFQFGFNNQPPAEAMSGKERGFIKTVRESPNTSTEVAYGAAGTYDPIGNEATLKAAKEIVDHTPDEAVRIARATGPATPESNAISLLLIDKYQKAGQFQDAIDLVEITAEKATKQGQSIQALSMYNRLSPEGILKFATRQLDKARSNLPKDSIDDLADITTDLASGLNKVNKEAAEEIVSQMDEIVNSSKAGKIINAKPKQVSEVAKPATTVADIADDTLKPAKFADDTVPAGELSSEPIPDVQLKTQKALAPELERDATADTAEMLANRLRASVDAPEKAGPNPVKDMVDTLHKFGKEFLKKQEKPEPRDPIQFVADVIKNKDKYREVWTKAQSVIRTKFKDKPELLAELDRVMNVSGSVPFADNQLSKSVQQTMREEGVSLADIVRQHYTQGDAVRKQLSDKLVEKAGLDPEAASELEGFISNKFNELVGNKKEQILKQVFQERFKRGIKPIDQKIIDLSNLGAFGKREYQQLVAKKLGMPAMDDDLARALFEKSQAIQEMPEGRAKTVATAEMLKLISDQIPSGLGKKISTVQTMAQLLNPKTAIRNVVGNVGFQAAETVSDVIAAPIDKAVSLVTGLRTKVLPSLKTQAKGFIKGGKEGFEDAVKGIDTLPAVKTQYDLPRTGVFDGKVGKSFEKLLNVELRATDRAFYQAAYDNSLDQQMRAAAKSAKKIAKPTDDMLEIAHHDALYRTFQDDSAAAKVFVGLKKALNVGKDFGLGDFILKYPKTPANILARGVAYSPAGFLNTMYQAAKPLMGHPFNQKAFVESFSRALVGTSGAVGMGAMLHRLGILAGDPAKDYDVSSLEKDTGLGAYKINASALKRFVLSGFDADTAKLEKGDTLISYDWFQPMAIGISLGANLDQNKGQDGMGLAAAAAESTKAGVDSLAELPLVTGITRFFKKRSLAEGVEATAESVPASFVPSLLSQIRIMTDQPRETYDPDVTVRAKNKAFAKVPFLSEKLPPQIDTFGNERKFFQGKEMGPLRKAYESFINPAWVTKYEPTPEAELVLNLFKDTGETKQAPKVVSKTQKYKGIDIELDPKQLEEMKRYVGTMTGERFRQLAQDPKFTKMAPEDQVDALSKELTTIGKIAKLKLLGNQFKDLAPDDVTEELIKQDEANLQLNTKAEDVYERLKSMDKAKANDAAKQLKEKDKLLFDKVKAIRNDEKEGLTMEDRKIKTLQVKNGFRANYLWKQLDGFKTREEKNAYIKELSEKGVITKNVMKQLQNLKAGKPYDYDPN